MSLDLYGSFINPPWAQGAENLLNIYRVLKYTFLWFYSLLYTLFEEEVKFCEIALNRGYGLILHYKNINYHSLSLGHITQYIIYITVLHNFPQIVLESLTVAADLVFVAILIKMVCVIQRTN